MTLIDELSRGDWTHSRTPFDATMSNAMTADKLRALWGTLERAGGPFEKVEKTRLQPKDAFQIVLVTCQFQRLRKVIRVVFDHEAKVAGLFYGPVPEDLEAKTKRLIAAASDGDFDAASHDFGELMRSALPPARFAATWKALEQKVGRWNFVENVDLTSEQGAWASRAISRFERERLVVKVVYDGQNEIVGLFFLPPPGAWTAPPYATASKFEEQEVKVGTSPSLPGILATPRGSERFPAIVLVHGSGPSDQDESVGGVKVFKDLAWGLASQGIAVLRYVKRSRQSPAGIVTQKEEVLDGAHDAIELLRHTRGVDSSRIYVLGHSQGGELAPRIAKDNPTLAGMIVLAGPTRPLQDVLIEQYEYLSSLDPTNTTLVSKIDNAKKFKRLIEDPSLRADQDVELPTGGTVKGAYFLDMRGYEPATIARALGCKVLVLQGERDYQVTMQDFEGWKKKLDSKKGATLRTYPSLNHLFVSGSGTPGPSEYERPGHVDDAVVQDIGEWITGAHG
ncbi:MAG: alpha/beta fold hydrolase [Pseudomonadota bacterium]